MLAKRALPITKARSVSRVKVLSFGARKTAFLEVTIRAMPGMYSLSELTMSKASEILGANRKVLQRSRSYQIARSKFVKTLRASNNLLHAKVADKV